ncbi:DNA cytosine methyltransferase [Acinetobacter baumannii]|uniref:DNA cytosine methyltransferase n=1 Tax=Acinetobacter baumannii TaxID=470 RepID=UPI000DF1EE1A|nr:DNA cytosine methyltransferase [Acinetobacter baumannii]RCT89644.1 DNA cytosine methyltransferase [Acinetobacter baumannii]
MSNLHSSILDIQMSLFCEEVTEKEFVISHIFDAPQPQKNEIVRLNNKVTEYVNKNGWMSTEQAKATIESWKQYAFGQYLDRATRVANSQKVVLSLFDLSGVWSQPWADAGYAVYRFDIQDDPDIGDVNKFSIEFFNDIFGSFDGNDIYAILAACPCTDFAVSGARHFAQKDADGRTELSIELVRQTLRTIEYFKPAIWAIENPVGRIEKLAGLQPWRLSFDPYHLGDTYTKKTCVWGRFNADLPILPVEPVEGSKMHRLYGGKSLKTKNARSVTPEGFAYGFFMANNAFDYPVMSISNKYDRIDSKLFESLLSAGVSEYDISEMIDDDYYDLNDENVIQTLNDLIRNLNKNNQ